MSTNVILKPGLFVNENDTQAARTLKRSGGLDFKKFILATLAEDTCCTKSLFADSITVGDLTITGAFVGPDLTIDSMRLDNGAVDDLAIGIGADFNNGFYGISDTQLGVAVEGVLVAGFNTTGVFTDVISEQTATAGVTIDSVLLKDGGVSNSAVTQIAGFFPLTAAQALSGAGAVNVTAYLTKYTSTGGAQALSLASGTQIGQRKRVSHVADGGSGVLTAVYVGGTTITFTTVGEFADLLWTGAAWAVLELGNTATPGTPPALA